MMDMAGATVGKIDRRESHHFVDGCRSNWGQGPVSTNKLLAVVVSSAQLSRMEPMALGSPTHSPSGSPGTNLLPPFLMGEFHQPITPRSGSLSPTKSRSLAFGNSPPIRSQPQHMPQYSTPLISKTPSNVSFSNKANGPPTQGLFDSLNQSEWNSRQNVVTPTPFTSPNQSSNFFQNRENLFNQKNDSLNNSNLQIQQFHRNQSFNIQQPLNSSVTLPNNDNVGYNNSFINAEVNGNMDEEENEYWVTIFGFPPSAANMILTQFSNCGNILEKKFPSQGNWVWLRFTSRSEAGRALALNGRILSGGVMIGVLPCNQPPNHINPLMGRTGARHLAVGPPRLQNNNSAVSPVSPTAGAQRSSSVITRALEYVFSW